MKFKVGDRVQIVANDRTPSAVGKLGRIDKAYNCEDGSSTGLYKVRLDNHKTCLPGVAIDSDIKLAQC